MRYSALAGGKYIRPLLVYSTGEALGASPVQLDAPACAVELIHAYSLVHDDLPAMDNDDLRRGKPTCHIAYGEATAILAGDALQALAFKILAEDETHGGSAETEISPQTRVEMIRSLAAASGSPGMASGQAIDLESEGKQLGLGELETMHSLKTGALIRASVRLGALAAGAGRDQLDALDEYARCIGLAFQIQDDILDIEGDTKTLGKPQGSDIDRKKSTYPSLLGLEEARNRARATHEKAVSALAAFDESIQPLIMISDYIVNRNR